MALSSYMVENYRSFADPTTIELRPLTLLFGYNSAGKSALLRALPLLAASVEPGTGGPIALRSPAAREATFAELRSRWTNHQFVRFGLSWDDDDSPTRRVELALLDLAPRIRRQVVERLRAWGPGDARRLDLGWQFPDDERSGVPSRYDVHFPGGGGAIDVAFDGLVPALAPKSINPLTWPAAKQEALQEAVRDVAARLSSLRSSVHWLGSVRALPPRRSIYTGPVYRLRPDGDGAVDALAYDQSEPGDGSVLRDVSAWYEEATSHRLELRREVYGASEQFYIAVSPLQGEPVPIHIVDTGEGMAQVLPVIVLGAMARHGRLGPSPVLALEQPELHLHPRAHRDVAKFFCELARTPAPPRMLIETHSENFLLRVQLEIVRGDLSPDTVVVYWIRQMDDGRAALQRITFDELGRPAGDNWPPGVFSEDIEQARKIALERRKRRRA